MQLIKLAKVGVCLVVFAFLSACQFQTPSDILLAPTYDTRYVPQTYNTAYDCRKFKTRGQTSGWRGIVGGKKFDFEKTHNVSREGCFETAKECQAFLLLMSGYIEMTIYSRCQPI